MPPLKLFLDLQARDDCGLAHWHAVLPKSTGLYPRQLHAGGYDPETMIMRVSLVVSVPRSSFVDRMPVTEVPLLTLPTFAHQWDPERFAAECWLPLLDEPCKLGDYISVVVRGRLQKLTVVCTNRAGLHH